jgi:tetrapyrrole methylase family protein / MazG family protein
VTSPGDRPAVVVVGLGPAGPEYVTAAATAAIARIPHRYVRTARHPSSSVVADATTFDHVYEAEDTFGDVYRRIADELVAAATEHGEILYAVPGSPLVLEATVRRLRADERVRCEVLPALSFLDLAYDRLGIDPVDAGLRLIDGHDFAVAAAGERGPVLVAHCHANWVLSDIKLAVEGAAGDEPVVLLQRLGCPDEAVVHTTWAELDRTVEADHLTSLYIPALGAPVASELVRFHGIVRRLRAECPWDREQTHASLARYAVEETYELVEAIGELGGDGDGDDELIGELGDVLLQVVLHSAIAEEGGRFSLADVAATVAEKMIRRHPHVFAGLEVADQTEVVRNWEAIKADEHVAASTSGTFARVPGALPSLLYARELASAAAKRGITWTEPRDALAKVAEELAEVNAAFDDPVALHDELGDLLLAVVEVARHRRVDPEVALRHAAQTYRRRVDALEVMAAERGIDTTTCGEPTLLALWAEAKDQLGRTEQRTN